MNRSLWWVVVGVVLAAGMPAPAQAAWLVVPPRPGQLGVGIQGQYGALTKTGDYGEDFGSGGGLSVRLRYRLRYERAIGISFERQGFEARSPGDSAFAEKSLTLTNTSIEFYQLFGTTTRTTRMLSVGFGLVQPSKKLNDGEIKLGGDDVLDGAFVSIGAGIERFIYQSLGIDLNLHYQAVFQNGSTNHNMQAAAGLIFYASY